MAIVLKYWKEKYPNIDQEKLINWLSDATIQGIPSSEYENYINKMLKQEIGIKEDNTNKKPPQETEVDLDDEKTYETENEEKQTIQETTQTYQEAHTEEEKKLKEDIMTYQPKSRTKIIEPPVPYTNPDLSTLEVPEDEIEPEIEEPEIEEPEYNPKELITKTITYQEYDEIIRPFRPFLEDIRKDSATLNKLAAQIDGRYMPPYMQIKGYIINHPIKDPNNTQVLLSVLSESNANRIEQRFVNITQAVDITRALAEQAWIQASINNYDLIVEKLFEDRRALVSLVYILENYCEQKQVSPFELSIPKKALIESIDQSFQAIKKIIVNQVIKQLSTLRKDFQQELGDVRQQVEKSITLNSSQLQEAVTKVLWKVKTDIETTNLEDIKQIDLWCINKRVAAYKLGGIATAIISLMTDDLQSKFIASNFNIETAKIYRTYTVEELTSRLGYKSQTYVMRAIPMLIKSKLIKVYANKTYSL